MREVGELRRSADDNADGKDDADHRHTGRYLREAWCGGGREEGSWAGAWRYEVGEVALARLEVAEDGLGSL